MGGDLAPQIVVRRQLPGAAAGKGWGRRRSPEEEELERPDRIGEVDRVVAVRVGGREAAGWLSAEEEPAERADRVGEVDLAVVVAVSADEVRALRPARASQRQFAGAVISKSARGGTADEDVNPADVLVVEFREEGRRDALLLLRREDEIFADVVVLGPAGLRAVAAEDDGFRRQSFDHGVDPADERRRVPRDDTARWWWPVKTRRDSRHV